MDPEAKMTYIKLISIYFIWMHIFQLVEFKFSIRLVGLSFF